MKELNYFIEKYALSADPELTMDELLSRDSRLDGLEQRISGQARRELELRDFQQVIQGAQLIPLVPEDVHLVFNGAKRLFVFGYFEYYFLTVSLHYLFLAAESALRNKHDTMKGRTERRFVNLKDVISALVSQRMIPKTDRPFYDAIVNLRNTMSHLTQPTIFPATKDAFERVAAMINQLYDE